MLTRFLEWLTLVKLDIVHPSIFPKLLPSIVHLLQSIANSTNGRMTLMNICDFIREQDVLLWCAFDEEIKAAGLTEIRNYPNKKMLVIIGTAGEERENWQNYHEQMEEFAKSAGCDGVESLMRLGWTKYFKEHGYQYSHAFMEKMFAK